MQPQNNYTAVYDHDRQCFLAADLEAVLHRTNLQKSTDDRYIIVPMVAKDYWVACETGHVYRAEQLTEPLSTEERLLILHHLIYAKEEAGISGREIPFHTIPGVSHFWPAFQRRTIPLLQKSFSGRLPAFLAAGQQLGGRQRDYGDASVTLYLLPQIPITYILWDSDDEFPLSAQILFDENITNCTHGEDVPVLGAYGAQALIDTAAAF